MSSINPVEQEFLTDRALATRYGVSRNTIWTWTRQGILPQPVRLGNACTRWRRSEVLQREAALGVSAKTAK